MKNIAIGSAYTASVRVQVDDAGAVEKAALVTSSGQRAFDDALLAAARQATYPLTERDGFRAVRPSNASLGWNAAHGSSTYTGCRPITGGLRLDDHVPTEIPVLLLPQGSDWASGGPALRLVSHAFVDLPPDRADDDECGLGRLRPSDSGCTAGRCGRRGDDDATRPDRRPARFDRRLRRGGNAARARPGRGRRRLQPRHDLLAKGYGLANVELSVPVKPETIFQSGSVGKQFLSAAVMLLVEQGKVSLDDSITKYFPEAPAAWKPILVKNLLSHTSGLAEYRRRNRAHQARRAVQHAAGLHGRRASSQERRSAGRSKTRPATNGRTATRTTACSASSIHRVTGTAVRRLPRAEHLQAAGHVGHAPDQRRRRHSEPRRRLRAARARGAKKPRVGVTHLQLHRRRHDLLQRARSRQVGRSALHHEAAQTIEPRPNVDRVPAE